MEPTLRKTTSVSSVTSEDLCVCIVLTRYTRKALLLGAARVRRGRRRRRRRRTLKNIYIIRWQRGARCFLCLEFLPWTCRRFCCRHPLSLRSSFLGTSQMYATIHEIRWTPVVTRARSWTSDSMQPTNNNVNSNIHGEWTVGKSNSEKNTSAYDGLKCVNFFIFRASWKGSYLAVRAFQTAV